MSDYDRVRALFPDSCHVGVWVTLRNGFEGLITARGAVRLRKPVLIAGRPSWDLFNCTKSGGLVRAGSCPR